MTPKQQQFCQEYVVDLNATQAAVRAGYSERTARQIASENLSKPDIQEEIRMVMEQRRQRTEISADWVIHHLRELVERSMQIEPARDEENRVIGTYRFNGNVAVRALDLLARHLGMFKPDSGNSEELESMEEVIRDRERERVRQTIIHRQQTKLDHRKMRE